MIANKPIWDDAPAWANWLAQDFDGEWTWFEVKPSENGLINGVWVDDPTTMTQRATEGTAVSWRWRDTLERRPVEAAQ